MGNICHCHRVFCDARPMKRRLDHPPLSKVKLPLARQQTVAQKAPRALQSTPFHKLISVYDQHVPDQVRMVDEVHRVRPHPKMRYVSELCLAFKELQPMQPEHWETAIEPAKPLRGREFVDRRGLHRLQRV